MQITPDQLQQALPILIAILIAVVAVFVIAVLVFGWPKVKQTLLFLMLQAKRYAKDEVLKTGDDQENWVILMATTKIPKKWLVVIHLIATARGKTVDEQLREIVKFLFKKLRDYTDDGKINNSSN